MTGATFSPDGQWMWTGTEWVPAPPSASPTQSNTINSPNVSQYVESQNVVDSKEIKLQREILQTLLFFTQWTSTFLSRDYSFRNAKWAILVFYLALPLMGFSILFFLAMAGLGPMESPPESTLLWAIILGVPGALCLHVGIKSLKVQIIFNKENDKKRYSMASGFLGSGIFAPSNSWIHQLDSMITKYEHLVNWVSNNANAEIQRGLMEIEIELTRLIKKRRMSQVLTGIVVGAAATAVVKSNWDGKHDR